MSRQLPFDFPVHPSLSAGDFLIDASNEEAHAWIARWPDWPSPGIALAGPAGTGKSHLAAIWREASGARPVAGSQELLDRPPAELFGTDRALLLDPAPLDRDRPGDGEEALFHLLNHAKAERLHLLFVAAEPPARWPVRLPDLASRLATLPVATLAPPSESLLGALMVKQFDDRQIAVGPELVEYLLRRIERSGEAVRRIVAELDRHALAEHRRITLPLARSILEAAPGGADGAAAGRPGMM